MNQISRSIDAIAKLVATAKRADAPAPAPLPAFTKHLNIGQSLTLGQMLVNGWYRLVLQTDNNLVLYADSYDGVDSSAPEAVWSTGQAGAGAVFKFQTDGNLVLQDDHGVKWSSHTNGKGGTILYLQDDLNLCLYKALGGTPVWCTNTRPFGTHLENGFNATLTLV